MSEVGPRRMSELTRGAGLGSRPFRADGLALSIAKEHRTSAAGSAVAGNAKR
jgi:hypothetical protein